MAGKLVHRLEGMVDEDTEQLIRVRAERLAGESMPLVGRMPYGWRAKATRDLMWSDLTEQERREAKRRAGLVRKGLGE